MSIPEIRTPLTNQDNSRVFILERNIPLYKLLWRGDVATADSAAEEMQLLLILYVHVQLQP